MPRRALYLASWTIVVCSALASAACGSSQTGSPIAPSQPALSSTDASKIVTSVSSGLASVAAAPPPVAIQPGSDGSLNFQFPCAQGGTVMVVASTGGSGGHLSFDEQLTFVNCQSGGTVLQSPPTLHLTIPDASPTSSTIVMQMNGGLTFSYNNTQGRMLFACTNTINLTTTTVSGSGEVTIEYPIGATPVMTPCAGNVP